MKSLGSLLLFLPLSCGALNNTISLTLSGNGYSDQIALRFDSAGSSSYNSNLDAWKLFSPSTAVPQLYVRTAPQEPLSVYTMPLSSLDTVVDLYVRIGNPGSYKIQAGFPGTFAPGTCLQLEDNSDGRLYTLDTLSHSFQFMSACDSLQRFRIHFHRAPRLSSLPASCFGSNNGRVIIQAPAYSNWSGTLFDSSGKIISPMASFNTTDTSGKLAAGLYLIRLSNLLGCQLNDTIRVQEPPMLSAQFAPADSLHITSTGEPVAFCNRSINALSYTWNFGDSSISHQATPQHTYYKPGKYTVQLTASNGFCKATDTRSLDVLDFTTGISNPGTIHGLQVTYSNGQLELRNNTGMTSPFEAKIFDLQGRILLVFRGTVAETYRFALPPAPAAAYLVEIESEHSLIRKKIILTGAL